MWQVTLGATGKPTGGAKRHPTVGSGVVLGAGSTVLGNVEIGLGATVGAAAIVTKDVPDYGTVIGVNKIVERPQPVALPSEPPAEVHDLSSHASHRRRFTISCIRHVAVM